MNHSVITLQDVSLRYRLIRERRRTFQAHLIDYVKGKRVEREALWALKNISLDLRKGEALGVVGPNGAGKSSLLKVISGVVKPAEGSVHTSGKVAPLIELAAGFDDELTARENIFLNASILGFSRREIEDRIERIIDFSELNDFIDTPLKHYSSGMVARLAFSVATESDPDILIIDEVLAVGDVRFRQKSKERILEFKNQGVTILFVSHDMDHVRSLCDKVLWLDHGEAKMLGEPVNVTEAYLTSSS